MNIATDAPKRPALRYYGGKWNLAPWIISHFPPHKNYVEPCGGAASVLLQKPRSPLETYNDLDGNVVNFFRVLRDKPDELIQKIRLTPWAREEYDFHRKKSEIDTEKARRFWVGCAMAISNMPFTASGMRVAKNADGMPGVPDCITYIDMSYMESIALRLRGVQIENKPYTEIIEMYDHAENLIFFDPPYVHSTRSAPNTYAFEWNDEQHKIAATYLRKCQSFVVVSGYACPLYADIYESHGWHRVDKESQTNSGGKRIESLWLSPRTWNALQNDYSDLGLFAST